LDKLWVAPIFTSARAEACYLAGRLGNLKRYEEIRAELMEMVKELEGDDYQHWVMQVVACADSVAGRSDQAKTTIQTLPATMRYGTWSDVATALARSGDLPGADAALDAAVENWSAREKFDVRSEPLRNRPLLHARYGQPDEAIRLIQLAPEQSRVFLLFMISTTFSARGMEDLASQTRLRALELAALAPPTTDDLGWIVSYGVQAKQVDTALHVYLRAQEAFRHSDDLEDRWYATTSLAAGAAWLDRRDDVKKWVGVALDTRTRALAPRADGSEPAWAFDLSLLAGTVAASFVRGNEAYARTVLAEISEDDRQQAWWRVCEALARFGDLDRADLLYRENITAEGTQRFALQSIGQQVARSVAEDKLLNWVKSLPTPQERFHACMGLALGRSGRIFYNIGLFE